MVVKKTEVLLVAFFSHPWMTALLLAGIFFFFFFNVALRWPGFSVLQNFETTWKVEKYCFLGSHASDSGPGYWPGSWDSSDFSCGPVIFLWGQCDSHSWWWFSGGSSWPPDFAVWLHSQSNSTGTPLSLLNASLSVTVEMSLTSRGLLVFQLFEAESSMCPVVCWA